MHSLTICFGPAGTVWTLLFKSQESFDAASAKSMKHPGIETHYVMEDDFGQIITVRHEHLIASLLEDMDLSQMAQVERGLHQAKAQAKAQERAMADPVILQSLRRQQQGPAVMSPVPGGRFNG